MLGRMLSVIFLAGTVSTAVAASSSLLPGTIDFSESRLWGKEVRHGLNDEGDYTGVTHWYTDDQTERNAGRIEQKPDTATGYLSFNTAAGLHRTIQDTRKQGPRVDDGEPFEDAAVYFDADMTFAPFTEAYYPTTNAADRIICWVSKPDLDGPSRFMITAGEKVGSTIVRRDYKTSTIDVSQTRTHRLTLKVYVDEDGVSGFNVYLDGALISSEDGATTFFPSMASNSTMVYSFGVYGAGSVNYVNFTRVDPITNPDYAKDDLSPLRQGTIITVDGYPAGAPALTNFPLLVRISEEKIRDFSYRYVNSTGSNLRFSDENGKILPFEVDTWNPEGESLVWVKVPYLMHGTKITMQWDQAPNTRLPSNDSKKVWSDYIAVWHMNEEDYARDSSGNGFLASVVPDSEGSVAHLVRHQAGTGDLVQLVNYGTLQEGSLVCKNYEERFPLEGNFTFTGWYRYNGLASQGQSIASTKGGIATSTLNGWCLVNSAPATGKGNFYGDGSAGYQASVGYDDRTQWAMFGMTYADNMKMSVYGNGEYAAGGNVVITPTTNDFRLGIAGCSMDEIRIAKVVRDEAWLKAEYEQEIDPDYTSNTGANSAMDYNFWVIEPNVSPLAWMPEEYEESFFRMGRARYGVTTETYYDAVTGARIAERPTTACGSYRVVFTADDGRSDPLTAEFYYVIYETSGYSDLPADRVMLFNSDNAPGCPVTYQGYYDLDGDANRVWSHVGDAWPYNLDFKYVQRGDMHTYFQPGSGGTNGVELWRFEHARIGNLFASPDTIYAEMNLLPWGGTARRVFDSEKACDSQEYAGTLILQNISLRSITGEEETPAAAYSPRYTNGVGAVYFDAVNAFGASPCVIKVQKRAGGVEEWTDVEADVYRIVGGHYDSTYHKERVSTITLDLFDSEGACDRFFRVIAWVDEPGDVEFRIVRDDEDDYFDDPDGDRLALIDNIVVGPVVPHISLEQYGARADESLPEFRGQRAPFDVAFPCTNDFGRLHGAVKVNYSDGDIAADPSYISSLTMIYRWRYLNQAVDDWKVAIMKAAPEDPAKFLTINTLEASGVGDIEYYFKAMLNVPSYIYHDYSGLGLPSPCGNRVRQSSTELSAATEGMYRYMPSPALGTNFFVRVRDGASNYESFRVEVRKAGSTEAAKQVEMEVYMDRTWRGFYQTLKPVEEGLEYRIVGFNRQQETCTDYQYNTNYFYSTSVKVNDYNGIPFSGVCESGDGSQWTTIPCDGVTGYLMFQFDEEMRALSIIHADYQNFNLWSDAYSTATNAYFTGTSSSLPTSGVSSTAIELSEVFTQFTETAVSNAYWIERFNTPASSEGPWAIGSKVGMKATVTPNGWRVMNGTWVSENYGQIMGDSIAFQMRNEGLGAVYPVNLDSRGIGEFSFTARIAQTYDIHSYDYYVGTNEWYSMSDYGFAAVVAMDPQDIGFAGEGAVSVLAHYRDTKGGYEARVERYSPSMVALSIYKWTAGGLSGKCQKIAMSGNLYGYAATGLTGSRNRYAVLFISCANQADGSVLINAGLGKDPVSAGATGLRLFGGNRKFYCVSCYDYVNPFTAGTFAIGCNSCRATIVRPKFLQHAFGMLSQEKGTNIYYGECSLNETGEEDMLPIDRDYDPAAYDKWNIYPNRLGIKPFEASPINSYGFTAAAPNQFVQIETSPRGQQEYTLATNIVISSYSNVCYRAILHEAEDVDVQIRTSEDPDGCDIVVDDFEITQWRGENFDDVGNPDRSLYDTSGPNRLSLGAPTNFVYTTGWVHEDNPPNGNRTSIIELNPMRTGDGNDSPAGIRGPLFDGVDGRGTGLGQFSVRYYHADIHTRLLLQIATNIDVQALSTMTKQLESATPWETVHVFDFKECTDAELEEGVCSYYVGEHGVRGVMRVILDPELVKEAKSTDPECNPERDPAYGRVYIVSAMAKDNPSLTESSWWGWNLRTARNTNTEGMFGSGDGLMQLLKDGYGEGMSFGLNDSVVNDVKPGDEVKQHMPFLQTPVFKKSGIGEVSFKARRYTPDSGSPTVALYGTHSYDPAPEDSEFEFITNVTVTCDRFESFRIQAPVNSNYTGFRFAVTGVNGISGERGPWLGEGPQRVLLDEVVVYEAVLVKVGFRNAGCFRSALEFNYPKSPFPLKSEQPICGEQWGFQTEIYAASLSRLLDLDTPGREPHVYVHWYEGTEPWGYTNWVGKAEANHGELKPARGTSLVFRSSFIDAPDAIAQVSPEPAIVQYMMEVVYYMIGQELPLTNTLTVVEWEKPSWYEPIDLNAEHPGMGFSAYNILDTVSPGWAWINEVNIFGEYDSNEYNSEKDFQYLEIAAPADADLTDWQIRFLVPRSGSNSVRTNTVAVFGNYDDYHLRGKKENNLGASSGMVFRVVGSLPTWNSGKLVKNDTIDGYWDFINPDGTVLTAAGRIAEDEPVGMQLVRPSGIVEHEIVALGTNYWISQTSYPEQYDPTNTVDFLNKFMKGSHFFYVGEDETLGAKYTLDVWTNRGENASCWTNQMVKTPGRINKFEDGTVQYLDPAGPPTPLGSSIFIWSTVVTPNVYQTIGSDIVKSQEMQILLVQRDSAAGTNITYTTDEWYEIDQVKTNGVPIEITTNGLYSYSVNVGAHQLQNITLEASAKVSSAINNPELLPEDETRYLPAIIDWFVNHKNAFGQEWPASTDGQVHQAKLWFYYDYINGITERIRPLTITEMYWLDICPTVTNDQYLIAGFTGIPTEVIRTNDMNSALLYTNRQISVFMAITNGLGIVEEGVTNTVYSPYVIRGLDSGVTSWDYAEDSTGWYDGWSNATFKATGILMNGLTKLDNARNWVPLRPFVFHTNSFYRVGCDAPHKPYTTEIEVIDPYSPDSWGYQSGWGDWLKKNGKTKTEIPIWHRWSLDERMPPVGVEILKPTNYYE